MSHSIRLQRLRMRKKIQVIKDRLYIILLKPRLLELFCLYLLIKYRMRRRRRREKSTVLRRTVTENDIKRLPY